MDVPHSGVGCFREVGPHRRKYLLGYSRGAVFSAASAYEFSLDSAVGIFVRHLVMFDIASLSLCAPSISPPIPTKGILTSPGRASHCHIAFRIQ